MSLLVIGCETVTTVIVPVHTVQLSPSSLTLEEGENGTISVPGAGGTGDGGRVGGVGAVEVGRVPGFVLSTGVYTGGRRR